MSSDYKAMDMPSHFSRTVLMPDPNDHNKWVRDDAWYSDTREINKALFDFYRDNGLLQDKRDGPIEQVVLMFSDFTEIGQKLLKSGAVDRWLGSFDRPGSKKAFSDVRYLEKALRNLAGRLN